MRRNINALVGMGVIAAGLSVTWGVHLAAQGSKPMTAVIVNDASSPVPVRVTDAPGPAPVRTYKRFGPMAGGEVVPTVPAGQTFVLTQVNVVAFPDGVSTQFAEGRCDLRLYEGTPGGEILSIFRIEYAATNRYVANQSLSVPIEAGEYVILRCSGVAADGSSPPQGHRATASGFFVPAAP